MATMATMVTRLCWFACLCWAAAQRPICQMADAFAGSVDVHIKDWDSDFGKDCVPMGIFGFNHGSGRWGVMMTEALDDSMDSIAQRVIFSKPEAKRDNWTKKKSKHSPFQRFVSRVTCVS